MVFNCVDFVIDLHEEKCFDLVLFVGSTYVCSAYFSVML